MRSVGEDLDRIGADEPAEQVDRVASTADDTVAHRIGAPVRGIFLKHMLVVVRVLALYEVKLAEPARVDKLLCLYEGGGEAADLTYHKLALGMRVYSLYYSVYILARECQRLLTHNMLARLEQGYDLFPMLLVGRRYDDCVYILVANDVVPIGGALFLGDGVLLADLFQLFGIGVADEDDLCSSLYRALKMKRAHTQAYHANLDLFHSKCSFEIIIYRSHYSRSRGE